MRRINIEQLSDMEIAQMFGDYVDRMDAKPRHTRAAIKEAEAFDVMLESELPRNIRLQTLMYDKMMRCAIEYEESGFIAGFKTAMALMSGNDDLLPVPTEMEETPKSSQKQVLHPTLTKFYTKGRKAENGDIYEATADIHEVHGNYGNCKIVRKDKFQDRKVH